MRKVLLPLFLATILAQPAAVLAQNATTSLRGVVKDPSGAVISGATITLHNEATGQTITASSAKTGEFQVVQIPPLPILLQSMPPVSATSPRSRSCLSVSRPPSTSA